MFTINTYGNGVIYIKHHYQDLGYSDEWFDNYAKCMDKKSVDKELLLIRN